MMTAIKSIIGRLNPVAMWRTEFTGYSRSQLWQDLLAGITVGVITLPVALAFGVASGAGPAAGLFSAIVAGFIASFFGGSRYQITGPTAAVTVVLLPIVASHGVGSLFIVSLLAGLILVTLGLLKIGRFVHLIPWPVITGFTTGVAIVICLQQFPNLLGVQAKGSVLASAWQSIVNFVQGPNFWALGLGLLAAFITATGHRISKRIPSTMLALVTVTLISLLAGQAVSRIGAIPIALPTIVWPDWSTVGSLLGPSLAVAVAIFIESLMAAVIADGMTIKQRHDPDRELIGQGLANIALPFFGGIPSTGSIGRTALNIRLGAHTRLSGMVHAIFLILIVVSFGQYASAIPKAALAGIIVVLAVRLIEFESIKALFRATGSDLVVMLLTAAGTILFDLVTAIQIGLVVAGLLFIRQMASSLGLKGIDVTEMAPAEADHDLLRERVVADRVEGPLFFGVAGELITSLLEVSEIDVLILRMRRVEILDASGAQALKTIKETLNRKKVKLYLSGLQQQPKELLEKMRIFDQLTDSGENVFDTTDAAIAKAWQYVVATHPSKPHAA